MESAQRELLSVLLGRVRALGLISDAVYAGAVDLVHAAARFPAFFQYPACRAEEAEGHESSQDPQ